MDDLDAAAVCSSFSAAWCSGSFSGCMAFGASHNIYEVSHRRLPTWPEVLSLQATTIKSRQRCCFKTRFF